MFMNQRNKRNVIVPSALVRARTSQRLPKRLQTKH